MLGYMHRLRGGLRPKADAHAFILSVDAFFPRNPTVWSSRSEQSC